MTVTYTYKVANARLCGFTRLLFYWKGSIYKLMYKEILIYVSCYLSLSVIYRFVLKERQRRVFEKVALYCQEFTNLIPLSFILGFYVAMIVGRWWNQYLNIPWPDRVMMHVASLIHGADERGRMMRRTIMRYLNLAAVLLYRSISVVVTKRFPSLDHVVESGLMSTEERKMYEELPSPHVKYWVPIQWAINLASQARQEGRIKDDIHLKTIIDEINAFRSCCGMLSSFDWISIPLVYTQVATLAVYSYFLASVLGSQYLDPDQKYPGHEVDLYIPTFNILQFFFYMGWIKVAEQLINPFGEDDDDFETNYMIDRNIQVSLLAVDDMYMSYPDMQRDAFWDDAEAVLPYTKSSLSYQKGPMLGSTANLNFDNQDNQFVMSMETIQENQPFGISNFNSHLTVNEPPSSPRKLSRLHLNLMEGTKTMSPFFGRRSSLSSMRKDSMNDSKTDLGSCSIASNLKDYWCKVAHTPPDLSTPGSDIYRTRSRSFGSNHDEVSNLKYKGRKQDSSKYEVCEVKQMGKGSSNSLNNCYKPVADSGSRCLTSEALTESTSGSDCVRIRVEFNTDGEEIYLPDTDENQSTVNSLTPLITADDTNIAEYVQDRMSVVDNRC